MRSYFVSELRPDAEASDAVDVNDAVAADDDDDDDYVLEWPTIAADVRVPVAAASRADAVE